MILGCLFRMNLVSASRLTRDRTADALNQFQRINQDIESDFAATRAENLEAELRLIETTLNQQQDLSLKVLNWFEQSLNPLLALCAKN